MKISTKWLKDFIDITPPWTRIADRLTMAGLEVKKIERAAGSGDYLLDVEITTNRADWISHWGVAREIAAVENISLKTPNAAVGTNRTPPAGWKIKLKDADGCPYYSGVLIEGLAESGTPDFIVERLTTCGVRCVSLIVDITNYVMLEIGQPLHAFDADVLQGREIQLRKAKQGEKFQAINEDEIALNESDLVVADKENVIALAGIMGGKNSEITNRTRNVFLESAFFNPRRVRRSSLKHLLSSESSYRFERRVDPMSVDMGLWRAVALIAKYGKPRYISGVMKAGEKPGLVVKTIHLRAQEIYDVLGVEIKARQIVSILTRLGLDVVQLASESWKVKIPTFRPDLTRPIDLIEEIARLFGYDNIPETLPSKPPLTIGEHPRIKLEKKIRHFLSGAGLFEAITFSLISDVGLDGEKDLGNAVRIVNPQHKELQWMRPTLMPSLLSVVERNVNAGAESAPFFEIANIYYLDKSQKHPIEERVCALMLFGQRTLGSWLDSARKVSFYDIKGIIKTEFEILGCEPVTFRKANKSYLKNSISEEIVMGETVVGFIGEVKEDVSKKWDLKEPVFYGEFSLERILPFVKWIHPFKSWAKYPWVIRDLSITVKNAVKGGDVENDISSAGEGLIQNVELFDLFEGKRIPKGYKNLTFRVTYQSLDRTLRSEDIQTLHDNIAKKLVKKYQVTFQE